MANTKTSGLTALAVASVDDTDYIPTLDSSATQLKKLLLCDALAIQKVCQGRLTLESGVPVSTSNQTAKTNVYFTPYLGNAITLYDGTSWKLYTFTERTLALGTLTSGLPYDVFIYNNSGTLTLEATAWTNGTTRATAITLQDGVYVKSGSTTRRYLGTFYTTATTTTEDSLTKRFLWNFYNQVPRRVYVQDGTDSWTYGSAAWRQANNSTANQVAVINGLAGCSKISLMVGTIGKNSVNFGIDIGIGENSTTAVSGITGYCEATLYTNLVASHTTAPATGYSYFAWLEYGAASGTTTFIGDAGAGTIFLFGMSGEYTC